MEDEIDRVKRSDRISSREPSFGRRDLIKLGVGTGVALSALKPLQAQQPPAPGLGQASSQNVQRWPDIQKSREVTASVQTGYAVSTGPGWVNNSGRAAGNGPMDECSRRIIEFVSSYSESKLTDSLVEAINYLMVGDLRLPTSANGRMALETIHGNGGWYKRVASEGNAQNVQQNIAPPLIAGPNPKKSRRLTCSSTIRILSRSGN